MSEHLDTPDLLSAFIDHELDPNLEARLFEQLAESSELRAQLRTMQLIQQATRSYKSSLTPPLTATAAVFSTLGIQAPTQAVGVGVFSHLTQKLWVPVTIGVLSSLVTLFVILVLPPWFESNFENTAYPASTVITRESGVSSQPYEMESSNTADKQVHTANVTVTENRQGEISRNVPPHLNGNSLVPEHESVIADAQDETVNLVNPSLSIQSVEAQSIGELANARSTIDHAATFADVSGERGIFFQPVLPDRWELHLRSFEMRASPANDVPTKSNPWFNQMTIGVFYRLGDAQKLGIEVGQEAFPQNYDGTEHGVRVRYEQNLLTPWLTAVYNHDLRELSFIDDNLYPTIRFGIGITRERWPITRASAGLLWLPAPNVGLSLGVEGAMLAYSFQSTWFTTRKAGIVYGVTLRF